MYTFDSKGEVKLNIPFIINCLVRCYVCFLSELARFIRVKCL
jgi:hypothetical protein